MREYYYVETTKRVTAALSNWFRHIVVHKKDASGATLEVIKVPLLVGVINKTSADVQEGHAFEGKSEDGSQHDNLKKYYQSMPRMAILCNDISYDPTRAVSVNDTRVLYNIPQDAMSDGLLEDMVPVPYNFTFALYIKSHSIDFFYQIVENILPYFNPAKHLRIKEFPFINIERDLNVKFSGSVNPEWKMPKDSNARNTQEVETSLSFVVEGYMYRPISIPTLIDVINIQIGKQVDRDSFNAFLQAQIKEADDGSGLETSITVYGV